jgi:hypothetical protein
MDVEGVLEEQPMEIGVCPIYGKEGALWLILKLLCFLFFYFMHWAFVRCDSSNLTYHPFSGLPRILFPVGLYDGIYHGKRLWFIPVIWLK